MQECPIISNNLKVFSMNKSNKIVKTEISCTLLKQHVYSQQFKNYLSTVLYWHDNPFITKMRHFNNNLEMEKFYTYTPDCLKYYNSKELFYMIRDNIKKRHNDNLHCRISSNIKIEIEDRKVWVE